MAEKLFPDYGHPNKKIGSDTIFSKKSCLTLFPLDKGQPSGKRTLLAGVKRVGSANRGQAETRKKASGSLHAA